MLLKSIMRSWLDNIGDFIGTSGFSTEYDLIQEKLNLDITRKQYNDYSGPKREHKLTSDDDDDRICVFITKDTQAGNSFALLNQETN